MAGAALNPLRIARAILRWVRRFAILLVVVAMLAFNIATVTVAAVGSAVSALLGLFDIATTLDVPGNPRPVTLEADDLRRQNTRLADDLAVADRRAAAALAEADDLRLQRAMLRDQADTVLRRVRTRTAEVAVANAGSTIGESIPFYGVAIIVAATSYELWSSCENMKDIRGLSLAMGLAEDEADVTHVCGLEVPTVAQIWQAIKASPGAVWRAATEALGSIEIPDLDLPSLEMPDFGGWWDWAVSWWWSEDAAE